MFEKEPEERFVKSYPEFCYNGKPLSPYWDLWQDGAEFGYNKGKEINEVWNKNLKIGIGEGNKSECFESKGSGDRRMTDDELIKLSRENLRKSKQGSLCELYDEAFIKGYKLGRPKWHKVADGDLPKEECGWVCNQDGLPCYFDWGTEQWLDCEGTQIKTTEWSNMPHKE